MDWWQVTLVILTSISIGIILGLVSSYLIITQILRKPFYINWKINQSHLTETRLELNMSNLIAEVKHNYMIAIKTSSDRLLPFQNRVWANARWEEINKLPITIRENLIKTYWDMRQANSIVRTEMKFGYRSYDLDAKYQKLRSNIAENLNLLRSSL